MKQMSIRKEVQISGKGIHSGRDCTVKFIPAEPNSGICFIRTDIPGSPEILASWKNVCHTDRATSLGTGNIKVKTVEHVLSALNGLGVTNLRIELNNEELPILDGSSKIYCEVLHSSGMIEQNKLVKKYFIQNEYAFSSTEKNSIIKISPAEQLQITYHLNYFDTIKQSYTYVFSSETYASQVAPARTFSLISDLEYLFEKGLIGGINEAAGFVVVDDFSKIHTFEKRFSLNMNAFLHSEGALTVASKEKLRFSDEMVRHKILDIIGDLTLSENQIVGYIEANGTGHAENIGLIKKIFG